MSVAGRSCALSIERSHAKAGVSTMTTQPEFATIQTNGIRLRVALAGKGPLVVLVHGWPESWYSWRHQIPALAAAGYRVAAPDVRGYGGSDKPAAIEAYAIKEMCADIGGARRKVSASGRQAIYGRPRLGSAHCLEHFAVLSAKGSGRRRTERPSRGTRPGSPHRAVSKYLQGPFLLSALFPATRRRGGRISRPTCTRPCGRSTIRLRAKAERRDPGRPNRPTRRNTSTTAW